MGGVKTVSKKRKRRTAVGISAPLLQIGAPRDSVAVLKELAEALSQAIETSRSTTLVLEDIDRLPVQAQAVLVRHLKERTASSSAPRLVATTSGSNMLGAAK